MIPAERWMTFLMRVGGLMCATAAAAVFFPESVMQATHRELGLGEFPASSPITLYLARSTSALCAFYGILLLMLSTDVRRYAPVITFQAFAMGIFAVAGNTLSYLDGMPLWWAAADGLAAGVLSVSVLLLQRKAAQQAGSSREPAS